MDQLGLGPGSDGGVGAGVRSDALGRKAAVPVVHPAEETASPPKRRRSKRARNIKKLSSLWRRVFSARFP